MVDPITGIALLGGAAGVVSNLFGGNKAKKAAKRARSAEEQRQAKINQAIATINQRFAKFDDNFYDKRRGTVEELLSRQLHEQYGDARRSLLFDLARTGNLGSSSAHQRQARNLRELAEGKALVTRRGAQAERQLRTQVGDAQANLVSLALATANPAHARAQAVNRGHALESAAHIAPLAPAFSDLAYGARQAQAIDNNRREAERLRRRYAIGSALGANPARYHN